ncbi:MAG TPA: LamG-like jellyroll fold domain-containing protein [Marmoricola sp.]
MPRHRRRRSPFRPFLVAAVAALVVLTLGSTGTLSSWTAAGITNDTNKTAAASVAFTHTYPPSTGTVCSGGPASSSAACTGVLVSGSVPATGNLSAQDAITNNGTAVSSTLSQSVAATSCEPVQFANTGSATTDPLLPRYSTQFGATDKWGTTNAASFNGSTDYGSGVVSNTTSGLLSNTYSIGVWFKVANGYSSGGGLISFDSTPYNATGTAGTLLVWMDGSGKIRFRVVGTLGTTGTAATTGSYNNGGWHFALVTQSLATVSLSVDGTSATGLGLSALSANTGYWHVGWGDFTSVTNAPSSWYLNGALSGAFLISGTALSNGALGLGATTPTPTQLYNASSASAYSTLVKSGSPTDFWMLGDSGTTTFTGSLPVVGAGNASTASAACKSVDLGWSFTNPSGTATSATTSLYTFVTAGATAVGAPGPLSTQQATLTLARDSAYNAYVAGLHLFVPMTSTISTLPGNRWPLTFSWTPGPYTTIVPN